MRRFHLVSAVLIALLAVAASAAAQTPDDVLDDVRDRGLYVAPGVDVDVAAISASVARANGAGYRFVVVVLDEEPIGGSTVFSGAVLDRLGTGTVLTLSADDYGADSDELDADAFGRAIAAAGDGDTDDDVVERFVDELVAEAASTDGSVAGDAGGDGGGGGGWWILLVIVVVGVGFVWWLMRRQKSKSEEAERRRIAEARAEIEGQLSSMANTILEITDHVSATESREDNEYLQQASATFNTANETFAAAQDLATLEDLSDRLDEARWQLDAAEALAEGREIPPKPSSEERHACFFDPTHRGPFEDAQLRTEAGTKSVRVCREDAERLRRGEEARTRMIEVGGRSVPASAAPRSHGGGGLGGLDIFSILVGGMGQARSYDWGRPVGTPSRSFPARTSTRTPSGTASSSRSRGGKPRVRGGGRRRSGRRRR